MLTETKSISKTIILFLCKAPVIYITSFNTLKSLTHIKKKEERKKEEEKQCPTHRKKKVNPIDVNLPQSSLETKRRAN